MKKKDNHKIIIEIIGAIAIILVAIIQTFGVGKSEDEEEKTKIDISVEGSENTVINGDNNEIINKKSINNYATTIVNLDYSFDDKSIEELLGMANSACINGEYNYAFDIYNHPSLAINKLAMLNQGYIYEHGLSYVGVDYSKAKECYELADCVEGKRNLLSLYLKTGEAAAGDLFRDLLWNDNDNIVWNYISKCLYNKSWEMYSSETSITKDEFEFVIDSLYEWEYTDNYYQGYNPPQDTELSRWIYQGTDYEVDEGHNHPYDIYREQVIKFSKEIDDINTLFYMQNETLYPLN